MIALILLVGGALRIAPLTRESVWMDETFTHMVSVAPIGEAMEAIREDRVHPPLYYMLERGFVAVLGDGPAALRTLSAISSLLLIVSVIGLTRSLTGGNQWVALPAGTLVALSDIQVYHAVNARSYALWAMEITLLTWTFIGVLRTPFRTGSRIGYGATALVAALTHYFTWLYIAALGVAVVLSPPRRGALRDLALLSVPAAAATLAWGLALLGLPQQETVLEQLDWISIPTLGGIAKVGLILFGSPAVPHGARYALTAAVGLAALVWAAHKGIPRPHLAVSRTSLAIVASMCLVPPGLIVATFLLTNRSFWVARQLLPTQAFVAISLGLCIALLAAYRRGLAVAALVALVVLNGYAWLAGERPLFNDPYNVIAADLAALSQPRDLVSAASLHAVWSLNYYLRGADSARHLQSRLRPQDRGTWDSRRYPPVPDEALQASSAIWVVSGSRSPRRRDSLLNAGWRVDATRKYPAPLRPELWPADSLKAERLVPP